MYGCYLRPRKTNPLGEPALLTHAGSGLVKTRHGRDTHAHIGREREARTAAETGTMGDRGVTGGRPGGDQEAKKNMVSGF